MAATTTTSVLNARCFNKLRPGKSVAKPVSLQNLPKGGLITNFDDSKLSSSSVMGTTLAGAVFATLSSCDAAFAAQQIATIAEGDNRGLALLLPIVPAILWVLYNILQPALNQINKMNSAKGILIGLGLGGLASLFTPLPSASANEVAMLADAASSGDNRGLLLLIVVSPALAWVLFNILQPALNQINKMRSQ